MIEKTRKKVKALKYYYLLNAIPTFKNKMTILMLLANFLPPVCDINRQIVLGC